ncbi:MULTISPECIES: hypothetical protein [Pontibacillus]|uniref:SMODS-associated NUDIX domain-containing protein n=1 Tax=Pontibacillus chungwhensis TaxID=265426 RepID=A0ABY8UVU6_9BACI|nr:MULTISPECIES: hypothetical protein [Pontibacillus]MCD5324140.1 hypothetical protein [Pontibacillus sp. HN14]WIF97802.1 hypothetical protein QNI29_19075 [Pontibacillus chungwhensis]
MEGCLSFIFIVIMLFVVGYSGNKINLLLNVPNDYYIVKYLSIMALPLAIYIGYGIYKYVKNNRPEFEGVIQYPFREAAGEVNFRQLIGHSSKIYKLTLNKDEGYIEVGGKLTIPFKSVIGSWRITYDEPKIETLVIDFSDFNGSTKTVTLYSPNRMNEVNDIFLGADKKINNLIQKEDNEELNSNLNTVINFTNKYGYIGLNEGRERMKEYTLDYERRSRVPIHILSESSAKYDVNNIAMRNEIRCEIKELESSFSLIVAEAGILITNVFVSEDDKTIYKCLYNSFNRN